jgi:hypothetical protein
MSNDKTDYLEAQVLDRVFQNSAPDGANDGVYVALWGTTPTNAPNEANEITGGSYSPVQVTAANWSVDNTAAPRRFKNDNEVDFKVLDAGSQITVEGLVLYDGADTANDNALWFDDNFGSETVNAGNEFKLNAGDLTVEED